MSDCQSSWNDMPDKNAAMNRFRELACLWIEDRIDENEARELLSFLKSDREYLVQLHENQCVHFFVREKYRMLRDLCDSTETSASEINTASLSLDELIRLQNRERPISVMVDEYSASFQNQNEPGSFGKKLITLAQKCFWPSPQDWKESIAPVVTIICSMILIVCFVFAMVDFRGGKKKNTQEFAQVSEIVNAVWEEGTPEYGRGRMVNESRFRLKSGLVKLEINNGTTLILEGPTDLTLYNSMSVFCQTGKVSACVGKKAINFKINTPFGDIIDRGTEFFLDVSKEETQLEVIRGKVDFISPQNERRNLVTNDALRFNLNDCIQMIPPPPQSKYVSAEKLQSEVEKQTQLYQSKKERYDRLIDTMPSLLARIDFNDSEVSPVAGRLVRNGKQCPLEVRNCSANTGNGPGKKAISLKANDSSIAIDLPKKYSSFTIYIRVRIDQLRNAANVLCTTDSFDTSSGGFLWQIAKDGMLYAYLSKKAGEKPLLFKPPFPVNKKLLYNWCDFAITFDAKQKLVTQYVNGEVLAMQDWANPEPLDLDRLHFGNRSELRAGSESKMLYGAFAEIALFDSGLTKSQIQSLLIK